MRSFRTNSSGNPEPQNTTPLYPAHPKAKPFLSSFAKQHTAMSPYNLPDDHPQKYYKSGYTGFVPKARKYLGQGYPVITRIALQASIRIYNPPPTIPPLSPLSSPLSPLSSPLSPTLSLSSPLSPTLSPFLSHYPHSFLPFLPFLPTYSTFFPIPPPHTCVGACC